MNNYNKFKLNEKGEVKYYTVPSFDDTLLVTHAFTTRLGGVSKDPFNSLNLGFKTGDNKKDIIENFKIISESLESKIDNLVLSDQVHKTEIRAVTKADLGKGIVKEIDYSEIDGLVTNESGVTLCTFYADCVPLFYLDKEKKVVGLAHAGWRGTVAGIAGNMIDIMKEKYESKPEDIIVGIGPSIGECCYEVNKDVFDEFNRNFTNTSNVLKSMDDGKWKLNLWEANRLILEDKGVPCRNITISNLCTSCNNDIFYSYRKENGKTGRMAAIIQLK
ncbi:putative multi-copper polyphenol oxidoreductase laccase [Gottschalkia acidurici 9a]|uniref:Purine nucleoside phosphorylase n=1 Tax=Gottschalkia acidurici (strain ATCC 7906 / DSM 604 / BCRC 14475 / CIP 104303 / KCTC 5404 / NCIMB 10678 / 9a) TaxID=1128398 RepID=K0AYI8_GOTA9|nr:peptidoglycan editing factor PgeF [Gottschalkia acidurici]AFS78324.1 putative multi-copper polyphenol oxidoreductase laccase [Gottschalkia acidurici 9a]